MKNPMKNVYSERNYLMKKLLSIILVVLMCLPIMASCGASSPSETSKTEITTDADKSTSSEIASTSVTDPNTMLDLNFGGKTFTFLYWNDGYLHEYYVPEQTGDLIADSVFLRNATVEERLGIQFEWVGTPGNYDNRDAFVTTIANDVHSGGEFEAFSGYSLTGATIAMQGLSRDLMELDHLDFTQSWWPASLTDLSTINGRLYFCAGDIGVSMLREMNCTIFNKTMANELNIGSLYEMVDKGAWTLDKMSEFASAAYSDLNGNMAPDMTDQFGIGLRAAWVFDTFYTAAGLRTVVKDADDTPVMASDFTSERTQELLEKVVSIFHNADYTAYPTTLPEWSNKPFADGRVLFIIDSNQVTSSEDFADTNVTYGILPVPKMDEAQENYHSLIQLAHSNYSISNALSDEDANMAAAVLECMAHEAYTMVTPAAVETAMKLKYASGDDDSRMYDLLRETVSFDLGRVFSEPLGNIPIFPFRNACNNGSTNWASISKAESKRMQQLLEKIISEFDSN